MATKKKRAARLVKRKLRNLRMNIMVNTVMPGKQVDFAAVVITDAYAAGPPGTRKLYAMDLRAAIEAAGLDPDLIGDAMKALNQNPDHPQFIPHEGGKLTRWIKDPTPDELLVHDQQVALSNYSRTLTECRATLIRISVHGETHLQGRFRRLKNLLVALGDDLAVPKDAVEVMDDINSVLPVPATP